MFAHAPKVSGRLLLAAFRPVLQFEAFSTLMLDRFFIAAIGRRLIRLVNPVCWIGIFIAGSIHMSTHADEVDDFISGRMQAHSIPGLSLAIIQDGKIIKARGYGFTDKSNLVPVTTTTLFQAGSISKSLSAFAALHLVQDGRLSLDADVNTQLRSWKVPENEFTRDKKVTLRAILSHSAGLTVHGFPGYLINWPVPTLQEVLDGEEPANTSAIRVNMIPGTGWRYSGGGYTVMQQLLIDTTGKSFPGFMRDTVLTPLGLTNSTYEQPLPPNLAVNSAAGYSVSGQPVSGRWHVYPEMAAAGLWTMASDLARFAIGVQQSLAGKSNPVLSLAMTGQMLTVQNPSLSPEDGLGLFVGGSEGKLRFWHDGRNAGFDALMIASVQAGNGAVILINANDDSKTLPAIVKVIAKKYQW